MLPVLYKSYFHHPELSGCAGYCVPYSREVEGEMVLSTPTSGQETMVWDYQSGPKITDFQDWMELWALIWSITVTGREEILKTRERKSLPQVEPFGLQHRTMCTYLALLWGHVQSIFCLATHTVGPYPDCLPSSTGSWPSGSLLPLVAQQWFSSSWQGSGQGLEFLRNPILSQTVPPSVVEARHVIERLDQGAGNITTFRKEKNVLPCLRIFQGTKECFNILLNCVFQLSKHWSRQAFFLLKFPTLSCSFSCINCSFFSL